jgi:hypothetical protein
MVSACKQVEKCQAADEGNLDLGFHEVTGVFPKSLYEPVTAEPVELAWRTERGLFQLCNLSNANQVCGGNYSYCFGLDVAMVEYLDASACRDPGKA